MNALTVKNWLKKIGKDRKWLCQQTGYTKGSVNNWLSAGRPIPEPAKKLIEVLMHGAPSGTLDDPFHVTFTAAEFEEIEQARQTLGVTRTQFYRDAVTEAAEKLIKEEKARGEHYPDHDIPLAKAAEDSVPYKA